MAAWCCALMGRDMLGPAATAAASAAEPLPPVGAFSQLMHLSETSRRGGGRESGAGMDTAGCAAHTEGGQAQ
jgi:hypothetical protein